LGDEEWIPKAEWRGKIVSGSLKENQRAGSEVRQSFSDLSTLGDDKTVAGSCEKIAAPKPTENSYEVQNYP
jgi:hypothetical protein